MAPIAIEGMIGAGKSSVLKAVQRLTGLTIFTEPVKRWEPFLQAAYASNKGHVALQARIMLDTCCRWPNTDLVERSPVLQPLTFIPALHLHQHSVSHVERLMLMELHTQLLTWEPSHTIFLTCSLAAAKERIRHRGRSCEKDIDEGYLAILHGLYEQAIHDFTEPCTVIHTTDKPLDLIAEEVVAAIRATGCMDASGNGVQQAPPQDMHPTMGEGSAPHRH